MRLHPGRPAPLGARWDGVGTQFALYSRHATGVELCLFEAPGDAEASERFALEERTRRVWHGYLPDVAPGRLYAYRVQGPWDPARGHRFNPAKLMIDPYARAICGEIAWHDGLCASRHGADEEPDRRDSAGWVPKGVVVDEAFPWDEDDQPRTPWNRTVVYECHVKGMTRLHPDVPPALRGTYAGLASEPVVQHLRALGVTAVELLPVHHRVSERPLVDRGLSNYWGYNTLGFFAPDARFARGDRGEQVTEFKSMVKALHRAGLEVILDVVYNHTAEGNHLGPALSLRGVDNAGYYQLVAEDPSRYADTTGCGNSLLVESPPGLQLLMDSLRYWVSEMHVDGFRFDLATTLARRHGRLERLEPVFDVIRQDPVLAETKLIVEPWDAAPDGYRLGGFPDGFSEWNGRYRDCVRRFWRGDSHQAGEFASRVAGSSDVFGHRDGPLASLNFVTSHDGFTLADLVSYAHKHNEANGEGGRDGENANWSANWGAEGPTESESIQRQRDRIVRNFLVTLAVSQGVPMLCQGDEMGRTQRGNNNAYCHDDETTWLDWSLDPRRRQLLEFARRVFELRARHPSLRRRSFFSGSDGGHPNVPGDVEWIRPRGGPMTDADWNRPAPGSFAMLLPGHASAERDARGRPLSGETLLIAFNAGPRAVRFELPRLLAAGHWEHTICTAGRRSRRLRGESFRLVPHSTSVLTFRTVR